MAVLAPAVFLGLWLRDRHLETRLMATPVAALAGDPVLVKYAASRSRRALATHCASCHGHDMTGDADKGAPNLTDGEQLLGPAAIPYLEQVIANGIRTGRPGSLAPAPMPAYAGRLSPAEIEDLMSYLYSLRGIPSQAMAVRQGGALYHGKGGCADCHGAEGKGEVAKGAPDLTDKVWLYGASAPDAIRKSITDGRSGACPGFGGVLDAATIRAMALDLSLRAKAGAD